MKILIVAEHASSSFGGEALIPYQYFKSLRETGADVHLLVHERTRDELNNAFPDDAKRLHFVGDSLINKWCSKIGKLMPDRLATVTLGTVSHLDTQIRQRRLARSLVKMHRFDVVHEPIPVSPKIPSLMVGLSAPVIIGPLNGGMDFPAHYDLEGHFARTIISILRWSSAFWNKMLPGKLNAALILVANKRTYNALPHNVRQRRIMEFAENGVDTTLFGPGLSRPQSGTLRIAYVGRLVDVKRVDLLVAACARLIGKVHFELHIAGDGPLRGAIEKQVAQLLLTTHVVFHGRLSQSAVAELLRDSDVMVLPSMRECGGAVVLEAMASGVPVIATNWGGPADYVVKGTGILISPATPDTFVTELANAMVLIAENPQARAEMGSAARQRAQTLYDWRVKAETLLRIYEDVLGLGQKKKAAGI